MSDINVVPYIDVMLVLLVIFMATAPMMTQGVKVNLPSANSEPVEVKANEEQLIVSILANGRYVLERGDKEEKTSELSFISAYVTKVLKQQPTTDVLVRGDELVPYGKVVQLMAALQSAGAETVGLVTEAPDPEAKH
jgi:biopolymer transport protein TolR